MLQVLISNIKRIRGLKICLYGNGVNCTFHSEHNIDGAGSFDTFSWCVTVLYILHRHIIVWITLQSIACEVSQLKPLFKRQSLYSLTYIEYAKSYPIAIDQLTINFMLIIHTQHKLPSRSPILVLNLTSLHSIYSYPMACVHTCNSSIYE